MSEFSDHLDQKDLLAVEPAAWRNLLHLIEQRACADGRRYGLLPSHVDEVRGEVILGLVRGDLAALRNLRSPHSILAYIASMVHFQTVRVLRRSSTRRTRLLSDLGAARNTHRQTDPDQPPAPERVAPWEGGALEPLMLLLESRLTPLQSRVVRLRVMEGATWSQIGQALSRDKAAVRMAYGRALARLRARPSPD